MAAWGRGSIYKAAGLESRAIAAQKQALHFALQFRHGCIEGFASRIDDDGPLWAQPVEVEAYSLADTPLDTVPHDRFTDRARDGEPDTRPVRLRLADTKSREEGPRESGTLVINSSKVFGSQQTDTFRKTRDGVLPLGANGQFLAPACAATGQNGASVLGLHPGAKPMRLRAVSVIRLKSTFRHVISSI